MCLRWLLNRIHLTLVLLLSVFTLHIRPHRPCHSAPGVHTELLRGNRSNGGYFAGLKLVTHHETAGLHNAMWSLVWRNEVSCVHLFFSVSISALQSAPHLLHVVHLLENSFSSAEGQLEEQLIRFFFFVYLYSNNSLAWNTYPQPTVYVHFIC